LKNPREIELQWYREHGLYLERIVLDGKGELYVIGDRDWNRLNNGKIEYFERKVNYLMDNATVNNTVYFVTAPDDVQFTSMYKQASDAINHAICKSKYGKYKCKLTKKEKAHWFTVMKPNGFKIVKR